MAFERTFQVSWAQLDSNAHMANTAYLDVAVDVRFMYFASQGFPPGEWARHGIGPVVLAGLNEDCSRFRLRNEIRREDGELAARVTSLGGILDLGSRKLAPAPEALAAAMRALSRSDDFEPLVSDTNFPQPKIGV